ncbi:MAG: hypothetical protein IT371_11215 [Deltaproteobacteria bacterium]|nr:hypothetical protein [Deltaproteobacteria bacterium]
MRLRRPLLPWATLLVGLVLVGCEPGESSVTETPVPPGRGQLLPRGEGKADGGNSCAGICGKQARAGCWCDAGCEKYGDCCADKSQFCDAKPASCVGLCGKKNPAGCWCDEGCAKYGDCCADVGAACKGGPVNKCAGVTCTPSAPSCDGASLVTVTASSCDPATGTCVEKTQKTTCPNGCAAGACKAAPPKPLSFFDEGLAAGAPITLAEAKAYFAPGSTSAALGPFEIRQRARQCNTTTGCSEWAYPAGATFAYMTHELWIPGPGWSPQKSCFQFVSSSFSPATGKLAFVVATGGRIDLQLQSAATGTVSCANVPTGNAACDAFSSAVSGLSGGKSCSLPNPSGSGYSNTAYPASVTLYDTTKTDGNPVGMTLRVTRDYVTGRSKYKGAADANGSYREVEYALYGLLKDGPLPPATGGTCKPTTCAAQGKTCGTIADGCSGTLLCGSCSTPYVCGTDNTCALPPGCNLQPCYAPATVGYTCCSPGKVTCGNGKGCTCYDACY